MSTVKVAILGFGTVGQGIYQIINEKREELKRALGFELEVSAILIRNREKVRPLTPKVLITDRYEEVLSIPNLNVVFEAIVGEEPAFTYLSQAIDHGCHIITANKKMFAKYGADLQKQAAVKGVKVGFEATTAGGIPVIKTLKGLLKVNKVTRIIGILNGTSNYILTQMRKENCSFEAALEEAQYLGYAEEDPYQDISGQDAFSKLMILSELSFGKQPNWNEVEVVGINDISLDTVIETNKAGYRYRHIAEVSVNNHGDIKAKVGPVLIGDSHPLYSIEGVNNAVVIETSYIGPLTLIGAGAGKFPTGSAMLEDYIDLIGKHAKQLVEMRT